MSIVEQVAGLAVLYVTVAFVIESLVETFLAPLPILMAPKQKDVRGLALKWLSAGVACGITFGFDVRFLSLLGLQSEGAWPIALDRAITGLLLARGSQAVHDLMSMAYLRKEALKQIK